MPILHSAPTKSRMNPPILMSALFCAVNDLSSGRMGVSKRTPRAFGLRGLLVVIVAFDAMELPRFRTLLRPPNQLKVSSSFWRSIDTCNGRVTISHLVVSADCVIFRD